MEEIGFLLLPVNSSLSAVTLAPDTIFFLLQGSLPEFKCSSAVVWSETQGVWVFICKTFHMAAGSHCPHQNNRSEVNRGGEMAQQVKADTW